MPENKSMKQKLIIQSFAPLFLILAVKNATWDIFPPLMGLARSLNEEKLGIIPHILNHPMFLIWVLEIICMVWILYALLSIRSFKNLETANFSSQGEKLQDMSQIPDSGVTFFMTYVLPMVLDDIGTWKGFIVFVLLMLMLYALMWKTNLYYQNPVLTILGYNIVSFKFDHTELSGFEDKECIGITRDSINKDIKNEDVIKRQYIADNVFLIYNDAPEEDGGQNGA